MSTIGGGNLCGLQEVENALSTESNQRKLLNPTLFTLYCAVKYCDDNLISCFISINLSQAVCIVMRTLLNLLLAYVKLLTTIFIGTEIRSVVIQEILLEILALKINE